jgi:hypothetical protein
MASMRFGYWLNWQIFDKEMQCLFDSRIQKTNVPHQGFYDLLTQDPNLLCKYLRQKPQAAFLDNRISELINRYRILALSDKNYDRIYKEIMDALKVDGRGKDRTSSYVDKLKVLVEYDKNFFVTMLRRPDGSIENAIYYFLERTGKDATALHMHQKVWQVYSEVFKTLREKLSELESLHFLECAGDCIGKSSTLIMVKPEDRRLRYVKSIFPT